MRVCIDTTALAISGAGVRRVLAEATTALAQQHDDDGLELRFFPFKPRPYASGGRGRAFEPIRSVIRPVVDSMVSWWSNLGHPTIDGLLDGADLYQISEYVPYPVHSATEIAIVHDLVALRHPEWCAPHSIEWQRERLEHIAERAFHVIVPSEPVKRSWLTFSGWRESRVSLVPWGVDDTVRRRGVGEIEHVKDRLKLRRPYILHLGTIEPRKNLTFVLHAFERACREFSREFDLVLAGPRGWRTELFDQAVEYTGVSERVRRLGAVPEEYLPALLSGASAVVSASHEEGFGLAALEALACGTPVISTHASTLPDELRPYCMRVGGNDEEELAQALVEIVDDEETARQTREEAASLARARTWQRVAEDLRSVYKSLL